MPSLNYINIWNSLKVGWRGSEGSEARTRDPVRGDTRSGQPVCGRLSVWWAVIAPCGRPSLVALRRGRLRATYERLIQCVACGLCPPFCFD